MSDDEAVGGYYELHDDNVVELGRFMQSARLSNGTIAGVPAGMSELLAQAVLNWFANRVFDDGVWVTRSDIESDPDFGEVEVTEYGEDGEVVKLRHRTTGVVALGTSKPEAWKQLKSKVRARANAERDGNR